MHIEQLRYNSSRCQMHKKIDPDWASYCDPYSLADGNVFMHNIGTLLWDGYACFIHIRLSFPEGLVVLVFFCPSSSRCEVQLGWSPLVAKRTIHDDSKSRHVIQEKNMEKHRSDSRFFRFWSCSNLRKAAFREVWRAKGLTSKGRRSTQSARLVQRHQRGKCPVVSKK